MTLVAVLAILFALTGLFVVVKLFVEWMGGTAPADLQDRGTGVFLAVLGVGFACTALCGWQVFHA